jgi:hypothetical protein
VASRAARQTARAGDSRKDRAIRAYDLGWASRGYRCDSAMELIEADMLRGLGPETLDVVREALRACAHSLEATRPLPTPRRLRSAKVSRS